MSAHPIFENLRPVDLSKLTTYSLHLASLIRRRITMHLVPSGGGLDEGMPIEIKEHHSTASGCDLVVISPMDGRPYRVSITPDFKVGT